LNCSPFGIVKILDLFNDKLSLSFNIVQIHLDIFFDLGNTSLIVPDLPPMVSVLLWNIFHWMVAITLSPLLSVVSQLLSLKGVETLKSKHN
jgi:hypothetical protein